VKIAFDENIPIAMVRVFQTFANERQLQNLVGGKFEIKSARDYTPLPGDADHIPKNDVPWLRRFAADGGKVVISDNRDMKKVPQERLALVELGLIVLFFENQWSGWKFFRKCALLLHWWPVIAAKIKSKKTKPGTFWHIPSNWPENGRLKSVSNQDQKALQIEKQKAASGRPKRKQKSAQTPKPKTSDSHGPLFDFAKQSRKRAARKKVDAKQTETNEAKNEGSSQESQSGDGR